MAQDTTNLELFRQSLIQGALLGPCIMDHPCHDVSKAYKGRVSCGASAFNKAGWLVSQSKDLLEGQGKENVIAKKMNV